MSSGEWLVLALFGLFLALVLLFPDAVNRVGDAVCDWLKSAFVEEPDPHEQLLAEAARVVEDQARDGMTTMLSFRESLRHHRSVRATEHLFTREGWS